MPSFVASFQLIMADCRLMAATRHDYVGAGFDECGQLIDANAKCQVEINLSGGSHIRAINLTRGCSKRIVNARFVSSMNRRICLKFYSSRFFTRL